MDVYTAGWVLPVTAAPVRNGAVGVGPDGRIAYVGPAAGAPPGERYSLGDAVLLPGLATVASSAADAAATRRMRDAGVTTLAMSWRGAARDVVHERDFRGSTYRQIGTAIATDRVRRAGAFADALDPARVGIDVGSAYAIDEDVLIDVCAWAVGEGRPIALSVGASPDEIMFLREASGPLAEARRAAGLDVVRRAHSAMHLLAELGIAAVARPLLIGGAHFDASDIALAAYYDCPVAYAPADPDDPDLSPLRALLDGGGRIALATTGDPLDLAARATSDPARAVRLVTLDGARALDLDAEAGSLDVGKWADFCAFALSPDDDRMAAAFGPEQALVARPGRRAVARVVGGHPAGLRGV